MTSNPLADHLKLSGDAALARMDRLLRVEGDDAFLRAAYQLALGRSVDGEGQRFYLERLQQGTPRPEVLWELARSEEGQEHLTLEPALWQAIAERADKYRPRRWSVAGLLGLPDAEFVEACTELFASRTSSSETKARLRASLVSGEPRYKVLLTLVAECPRSTIEDVLGLDVFIAQARNELFPVAATTQEMLAFEEHAFVDCAYKTLLGRAPDASGSAHYLERIRAGYSRTSIISELARSGEARLRNRSLPGLRSLCLRYRVSNLLHATGWLARLLRTESDRQAERQRRQIDSLARRISGIEAGLLMAPAPVSRGMVVGGHAAPYHEALLEIQRNNFERETIALRKLVARLIDGSEGNLHITRQRRFRRQRSTER